MKNIKDNHKYIQFHHGNSNFTFLPTGDIYEFMGGNSMINLFRGNLLDGSINNIYLRVYDQDQIIQTAPLLGIHSESTLSYSKDQLVFQGKVLDISYRVIFRLAAEGIWFWNVILNGTNKMVDLIYTQDIGIASKGGILANELYISQYIDHNILDGSDGYVACSRQNQPQQGQFPYIQQGAIGRKVIGYSTDATQFYGLAYKATNEPVALMGNLPNVNYQYEMAFIALQTEKFGLDGQESCVFYGIYKDDHATAISEVEYQEELNRALSSITWDQKDSLEQMGKIKFREDLGKPLVAEFWSEEELNKHFPKRKLEEFYDEAPLSFFTPQDSHVVLQGKEVLVERPHGHIITTNLDDKKVNQNLITSTNYMYGIFNSQTVVGNTSFHKLLSASRSLLNLFKNSGQRIYIQIGDKYHLLTMPTAYEMGINYSKWFYKTNDDLIIITSYTVYNRPDIVLDIRSESGKAYSFIVTNQLVMGEHEFQSSIVLTENEEGLQIKADSSAWTNEYYPDLHYNLKVKNADYTCHDDRIFYMDGQSRNNSLLAITAASNHFQLLIEGRLDHEELPTETDLSLESQTEQYQQFYQSLLSDFRLSISNPAMQKDIDKLNTISIWYTHNAMVHYAVPHGLEQPGGAAWGTRDVCQGPMEYFLATQHYQLARDVLLHIFSHQLIETKEWPQWFMFDKYNIQADEWHGDVVLWPLKSVGDYILATDDLSILHEMIAYHQLCDGKLSTVKESLLEHIKAAVSTLKDRFLPNTALLSYAGGDWDDTLQPAHEEMKKNLVSAWTVALGYQAVKQLSAAVMSADIDFANELKDMAKEMKDSFENLLVKDNIIAGFALFEKNDEIRYMLHPDDNFTGIHYRLLPMIRSIIAEIADVDQAEKNIDIIDQYLMCPDGVRLMDHPAKYEGGVSNVFKRAEQASNVGREISLQYVHAHIRYIESMAKLGKAERVWAALFQIHPINIQDKVPNARLRQSNLYFSSSDGAFCDRYEYDKDFDKLRSGSIEVKGGWRLYSSGPGIYLNQLISNVLGLRFKSNGIILDPVLSSELDGLTFSYDCFGKKVTFVYHIDENWSQITDIRSEEGSLPFTRLSNPYRSSGALLTKDDLLSMKGNTIHLYLTV